MPPIRLAIVGSGIFARDAHLPALKALGDTYEIVAIYSRNAETVAALAATLPGSVQTYTTLEPLLARTDIDAVDIILPIAVQPPMIEAALKAGKHVISEKPGAPDVESGRQLLATAHELTSRAGIVWMIAENIRFEPAYQQAGEIIRRGEIGKPIQLGWQTASVVNPQNKYYHTAWRRDKSFPGGFILDGGVHNIAAMRMVMGEIEAVSAFVTQVRPDLPPADTLCVTFRFANGALGSWTHTYVATSPWLNGAMQVIGERGAMQISPQQLDVSIDGKITAQAFQVNGVQEELAAFARAIGGEPSRSTPPHALQDVAVIQAILESARTGQAVQPVRVV
ncbi:MAG: Gfo/Idh/MocA family oxidoreductase [Anaerolineae bacterium]|nr:Gfo/Idh/MocA family oxidoreductase [Anaerolineae bacterium]